LDQTYDEPSLVLLPEVEARATLAGRPLSWRLIRPPYPALGVGSLRVLRIAPSGATTEIVAGYDRYERLPE
jgi:hypothetical protein